jgi:hypothetical protein
LADNPRLIFLGVVTKGKTLPITRHEGTRRKVEVQLYSFFNFSAR